MKFLLKSLCPKIDILFENIPSNGNQRPRSCGIVEDVEVIRNVNASENYAKKGLLDYFKRFNFFYFRGLFKNRSPADLLFLNILKFSHPFLEDFLCLIKQTKSLSRVKAQKFINF